MSVQAVTVPRNRRLRTVAVLALAGFAVVIFPWTGYLAATLPRQRIARHWDVLWSGFDVGVGMAAIATIVAIVRRERWVAIAAAVLGTLLVCDAWFDVLTSLGSHDLRWALVEALGGELPLAALCFWLARDAFELPGAGQAPG
ncbi:MAG: hypothetical protein WBB74_09865 [Gaiellaceae bacterium]